MKKNIEAKEKKPLKKPSPPKEKEVEKKEVSKKTEVIKTEVLKNAMDPKLIEFAQKYREDVEKVLDKKLKNYDILDGIIDDNPGGAKWLFKIKADEQFIHVLIKEPFQGTAIGHEYLKPKVADVKQGLKIDTPLKF